MFVKVHVPVYHCAEPCVLAISVKVQSEIDNAKGKMKSTGPHTHFTYLTPDSFFSYIKVIQSLQDESLDEIMLVLHFGGFLLVFGGFGQCLLLLFASLQFLLEAGSAKPLIHTPVGETASTPMHLLPYLKA
jgi:hypothetical protein